MNCKVFEDNISSYLDEELKGIDKIEFELHLLKCKDCRLKYENTINIIKLLKETNEVELPKNYHDVLIEKINKVRSERKKITNRQKKWTYIAASFLLLISSVLFLNNTNNMISKHESVNEYDVGNVTMEDSTLTGEEINEKKFNEDITENESENNQIIEPYRVMLNNDFSVALDDRKIMTNASRGMVYGRKLVKTENIEMSVIPYDDTVKKITEYVEKLGGYIESLTIDYSTNEAGDEDNYLKNGSMKLRITEDKFEDAVQFIKSLSDVKKHQHIERDITELYYEIKNIINNLRFQESIIIDKIAQTEDEEKIIKLEKELETIRNDIESNTLELDKLDNSVYMPKINLILKESNTKNKLFSIFFNK